MANLIEEIKCPNCWATLNLQTLKNGVIQCEYCQAFLTMKETEKPTKKIREIIVSYNNDSQFEQAARLVIKEEICTASLLRSKLQVGFANAYQLIEELETAGIVGCYREGSSSREVLIEPEEKLKFLYK